MLVTYKIFKGVTLIEGKDTWMAKEWAHAFLSKLDFVDWSLLRKLITNCDPKFFSKFWTALFEKLGMKLFYSIVYHPQTDGSNKRTNQTVKNALQFFVYILNNPGLWPQILLHIQAIINNTSSSSIGKAPNEVAYNFSPYYALDFLAALSISNALAAYADIVKAVFFAFFNQKMT